MTSHAPSFQTLPSLIVKKVVGYVVEQFRAGYKFNESMLISLLQICPVWRATTLAIAFSKMTLRIDQAESLTARFHSGSKLSIPLDQFDHSLVKTLRIETNKALSIPNSTFASWSKLIDPSVINFSTADSIFICISTCLDPRPSSRSGYGYYSSRTPAEEALDAIPPYELVLSVTEFMHNTRYIVPNISMASVSLDIAKNLDFPRNFGKVVGNCVVDFMRSLKKVILSSTKNNLYPWISPSWFSGLVRLDYCLQKQAGFTEIVRHNPKTLKYLDICCSDTFANELLCTKNNHPVVYSSLETLALRDFCTATTATPSNIPERDDDTPAIVHFPVIKSLEMFGKYPFAYNTLTKDINTTLKHMQVSFPQRGTQLVGLNEFTMLLSSKFVSLESLYINLAHMNGVNGLSDSENTSIVETIVRSLSCCTLYALRVHSNAKTDIIPSIIISSAKLSSLRLFNFAHVPLSLSDIIFLFETAPHVQVVKFTLKRTDTIVRDMSPIELLGYINTRIVPLNAHVRLISIFNSKLSFKRMAQMLVLLAIACPDITKISINYTKTRMLDEISTLLMEYPFSTYVGQCGKLIKIIQS